MSPYCYLMGLRDDVACIQNLGERVLAFHVEALSSGCIGWFVSGGACSTRASKKAKRSSGTSLRRPVTRREVVHAALGMWMETVAVTQGKILMIQGKELSSKTRRLQVQLSR